MAQAARTQVPKAGTFERGFKTWCENTSESLRRKLGKRTHDPLDADELATVLGVQIWELSTVASLSDVSRRYLSSTQGDEWSAVTVCVADQHIVVLNPRHSHARRASNLTHELAHIIRGHQPASMVAFNAGLTLRTFDPQQEAEADWLAGALLLPRTALVHCERLRLPTEQVIAAYNVSRQMLQYRRGVTGVRKQWGSLPDGTAGC